MPEMPDVNCGDYSNLDTSTASNLCVRFDLASLYGTCTNVTVTANYYDLQQYQFQTQYQQVWQQAFATQCQNQIVLTFQTVYGSAYTAQETEEQKTKREAAEKRAEELLMMVLTDAQRQQYLDHGYFETAVDDRVYRVKKGYSGNVFKLENGEEKFRYCIHPSQYVPDADTMVAQLLMLRNDEQHFLSIANRTELI